MNPNMKVLIMPKIKQTIPRIRILIVPKYKPTKREMIGFGSNVGVYPGTGRCGKIV